MAKYTVTYHCGHGCEVQLYGPHRDRERKIAWMEDQALCPECYRAEKLAEREAANAAAAQANQADGLATLEGSERQIAWAESIRRERMDRLYKLTVRLGNPKGGSPAALALLDAALSRLTVRLEGQASAKWWIEHRDAFDLPGTMIRQPLGQLIEGEMSEGERSELAEAAAAWAAR